jgi:hypothetical protein
MTLVAIPTKGLFFTQAMSKHGSLFKVSQKNKSGLTISEITLSCKNVLL